MADEYYKGQVLRVTGTYRNSSGAVIDPSVPQFEIKAPSGAITIYTYPASAELIRDSQGVYYADVHFATSGVWTCRHYSSGSGESAMEKDYWVKPSVF